MRHSNEPSRVFDKVATGIAFGMHLNMKTIEFSSDTSLSDDLKFDNVGIMKSIDVVAKICEIKDLQFGTTPINKLTVGDLCRAVEEAKSQH